MAWTRRLDNGRYQGCFRDAAQIVRSAGTFTQQAQAMREAGRRESEARDGTVVDLDAGKITWGAWFDMWHGSRSLSFATDEMYRSVAGNWLMPEWSRVRLMDITPMMVERWKKKMTTPVRKGEKAPCPIWTFRSALMLFKTSLNAATGGSERRIGHSPAKGVTYPDMPTGLERFLTPDEVEAILFELDGPNSLLVRVGIETGLRFGEIAGLHWHRIDLRRGVIHVIEKFNQKSYLIDPLPKDRERRTVPIPPDLLGQLIRYRDHVAPTRRRRGNDRTCGLTHAVGECQSDIVFRGLRGAPIKSNDWGKTIWKSALTRAGVEGRVRPHDMRHTYASWLIQEGVPLAEIAKVMGHSDVEITRMYAHLTDSGFDVVRAALERHRGGDEQEPVEESSMSLRLLEERVTALEELVRAAGFAANPGFTALHDATSTGTELAG